MCKTKGFEIVDCYDPQKVLCDAAPRSVDVATCIIGSLKYSEVFGDEALELAAICARLIRLHKSMVERRAH